MKTNANKRTIDRTQKAGRSDTIDPPKTYDNYIGIDPDVDKSGVAHVKRTTQQVECDSLSFSDLIDYLRFAKGISDKTGESVVVIVEASWLISHNWHAKPGQNHRVSAKIGARTGANHQAGKMIVEMARKIGLEVVEQKPLRKIWSGPNGKITHAEISAITGIKGRTNQEERDALLIAWDHAGLPMKI